MAKMERVLRGDFDRILQKIEEAILDTSISASLEDASDFAESGARCSVRVFERYSYTGGNRVSLNVTLVGRGRDLYLSAITSGGSQAMFFKMNTWGEESFLDALQEVVDSL